MAEAVVLGTTLRVTQNLIRLRRLFEALLGSAVARVPIRVILERQPSVGLLELILAGIAADAQNLVVVTRRMHASILKSTRLKGSGRRPLFSQPSSNRASVEAATGPLA
jgi:hypothetical protein